jgi:hypothetical protein
VPDAFDSFLSRFAAVATGNFVRLIVLLIHDVDADV